MYLNPPPTLLDFSRVKPTGGPSHRKEACFDTKINARTNRKKVRSWEETMDQYMDSKIGDWVSNWPAHSLTVLKICSTYNRVSELALKIPSYEGSTSTCWSQRHDGWLVITYIYKGSVPKKKTKKKNEYHSVIVIFKFNSFICLR